MDLFFFGRRFWSGAHKNHAPIPKHLRLRVEENEVEVELSVVAVDESWVSHSEGVDAIQMALKYMEQQEESTPKDLLLLKRFEKMTVQKKNNSMSEA